jgi:hypothetical protein
MLSALADLKAIAARDRFDGQIETVVSSGAYQQYFFHSTCAVTGDDVLVVTPDAGSGRWLRMPGFVDLSFAFTYATADAAVLYTMPTGAVMLATRGYWEITTSCSGGSSSAIGLSGPSPHNTKGDLLGGSGGDVAATLTTALSPAIGTVGTDQAAGIRLVAADTIKFDRITSAFTAGAGNAHVCGFLLKNAGA